MNRYNSPKLTPELRHLFIEARVDHVRKHQGEFAALIERRRITEKPFGHTAGKRQHS